MLIFHWLFNSKSISVK